MAQFTYKRDSVPVGEDIYLEVQFADSVGNPKDADDTPTIRIVDASSSEVLATTSQYVIRTSQGLYRYLLTVPSGFDSGLWNDIWVGTLDGYENTGVFDFTVNSVGSITPVNTTVEDIVAIGDAPEAEVYTQAEIKNINKLLAKLSAILRSTAFKPDGSVCNVFSTELLFQFLGASLSEFNETPTITTYTFSDDILVTLFSSILTQGAMLVAWSGQAILEAGNEWTMNDNGVTIQPAPVHNAISSMYNAQLSDYRAKLKEIKRNLRPSIVGISAGRGFAVNSPAVMKLRHLRERQII